MTPSSPDPMVQITMRRRKPFKWIFVIGATLIIAGIVVIASVVEDILDNQHTPHKWSDVGLLLGIVGAVVGWLVASYLQLRASVKQHSINLLFQTRFTNDIYTKNRHIILSRYPDWKNSVVTKEDFDRLESSAYQDDFELVEAIKYTLNYYEFIAVGIRCGDLDMEMMRETIKGNLIETYRLFRPLINAVSRDSAVMKNLKALYREWSYED